MPGGKCFRHPELQPFTVQVKDRKHLSTAHLPETFEWSDEFYYEDNRPESLHILLTGDLTKLNDPGKQKYPGRKFGDEFPLRGDPKLEAVAPGTRRRATSRSITRIRNPPNTSRAAFSGP